MFFVVVLKGERFPGGTVERNLPVNAREVGSMAGSGNPLEGMATHSNILAWRIPMDRGAWQAMVHTSQRVGHD